MGVNMIIIDDKATIVIERTGKNEFSAKITGLVPETISRNVSINVGDSLTLANMNLVRDDSKSNIQYKVKEEEKSIVPDGLMAFYTNSHNQIHVKLGGIEVSLDLVNATKLLRDLRLAIENSVF